MSEHTFIILKSDFIPGMGEPIVIVSEKSIGTENESCEYFLFFAFERTEVRAMRFYGKLSTYRSLLESEGRQDVRFEPAIESARNELIYQCNQKFLETKNVIYMRKPPTLEEASYYYLYSLYVSGALATEDLEKIGSNTVNNDLRDYVSKILDVPKIDKEDIMDR